MKKLIVVLTIILFLIVPSILYSQNNADVDTYTPLTRLQAETWLQSITYEELLDYIIEQDYLEHVQPIFLPPAYSLLVVGSDVWLTPLNIESSFTIGDESIAQWRYIIITQPTIYKDVIPTYNYWKAVAIGVSSALVLEGIFFIVERLK